MSDSRTSSSVFCCTYLVRLLNQRQSHFLQCLLLHAGDGLDSLGDLQVTAQLASLQLVDAAVVDAALDVAHRQQDQLLHKLPNGVKTEVKHSSTTVRCYMYMYMYIQSCISARFVAC